MLLAQITDSIVRADNAGIFTDENRADQDYMEAITHKARALAILQQYSKTKFFSTNWTSKHIPEYNASYQEIVDYINYVKFPIPPVITLNDKMDGFVYVGTQNGVNQYRKMTSRATYVNNQNHRFTKIINDTEKLMKYFYSDGALEIYGNPNLTEPPLCDCIWADPTQANQYNKLYDDYPISLDLLPMMQEILFKTDLVRIYAKQMDTKSDSTDSLATPNKK